MKLNNAFIIRALFYSSQPQCESKKRIGKVVNVAIIGAPNAGKSTLINKILERKVSVSYTRTIITCLLKFSSNIYFY